MNKRSNLWVIWTFLLSIVLLTTTSCQAILTEFDFESLLAPEELTATSGALPAWLTLYFTQPDSMDYQSNGIDQVVVSIVNQAEKTIDVASFDLNLPSVIEALAEAKARGVQVRVVLDGVNGSHEVKPIGTSKGATLDAIKMLKKARIKVVDGGRTNGLMHDKFIIVDGQTLFVGSWNIAYNDTFRNNNNLLQITDLQLIANYQAKFNEMFEKKRFGTYARVGALNPELTIDGVRVENYFSPTDNVLEKIIGYVQGAQSSVRFMAFTFTHADLSAALIERAEAGVQVEGVIEKRGATYGVLPDLFCAELPVRTDGNRYSMHHKVIIIDDETVITGSFNFTEMADHENDENVIVIHDQSVATQFMQEFEGVYGLGEIPVDIECSY